MAAAAGQMPFIKDTSFAILMPRVYENKIIIFLMVTK